MSKNRRSRFTTCSTLFVCIFIVIVAAPHALTAQSATQAAQPPAPQIAPTLVPSHVVDLMTEEGIAVFKGQWKTMEAKIVEGPALANAMPGYKTSYDIMPHAGRPALMILRGRRSNPRRWQTGVAAAKCRFCGFART